MSDTAVFLVNPASDNGATGKRWPQLAHEAAAAGLVGDALLSERQGHLTELAAQAVDGGADLLVVVGGDGSVNEVANAIAGRDGVELAVIARGTGWDFARSQGLPRDVAEAARVATSGGVRTIDLGRATYRSWAGAEETTWFANIASAGMSGAIAQRANLTTKALGGKASYLLATLAVFSRWRNGLVTITVGGDERRAPMHDVIVANGSTFGGGMRIGPEASAEDGLFDVLLIGDITKLDLLRTMPKIYRGTHLPHPKAELLRGTTVVVEADEPIPVELDGEQPGTTPARFELVPRALRLRVPV